MKKFTLKFVELMPESLEPETLYVSTRFALVSHRCACGCGEEVVTPLSPSEWHLIYDGETISLYPSIGNWNFPCRSHYWIVQNGVRWAPKWETHISEDGFRSLVTGKKPKVERRSSGFWSKLKGK
jgi:hypothetical protein